MGSAYSLGNWGREWGEATGVDLLQIWGWDCWDFIWRSGEKVKIWSLPSSLASLLTSLAGLAGALQGITCCNGRLGQMDEYEGKMEVNVCWAWEQGGKRGLPRWSAIELGATQGFGGGLDLEKLSEHLLEAYLFGQWFLFFSYHVCFHNSTDTAVRLPSNHHSLCQKPFWHLSHCHWPSEF